VLFLFERFAKKFLRRSVGMAEILLLIEVPGVEVNDPATSSGQTATLSSIESGTLN
jgi:hypothetical protein